MSDDLLGPRELEKAQLERKIALANERTKLLANAFDRASTAVLSVGLFGPIASSLYGLGYPCRWVGSLRGSLFGLPLRERYTWWHGAFWED